MGQSYEGYVRELVRTACERGEIVDTAMLAKTVQQEFPDADGKALADCILAEVVRLNGNASIGH